MYVLIHIYFHVYLHAAKVVPTLIPEKFRHVVELGNELLDVVDRVGAVVEGVSHAPKQAICYVKPPSLQVKGWCVCVCVCVRARAYI